MKTKSKTPLLDSIRRKTSKTSKTSKTKRALPDDKPTTPTSKGSKPKRALPDDTPTLTLTQTEQASGKTIPEILKARRDRGEAIPKVFKLAAMPECARYAGGGYVMPM